MRLNTLKPGEAQEKQENALAVALAVAGKHAGVVIKVRNKSRRIS